MVCVYCMWSMCSTEDSVDRTAPYPPGDDLSAAFSRPNAILLDVALALDGVDPVSPCCYVYLWSATSAVLVRVGGAPLPFSVRVAELLDDVSVGLLPA